MQNSAVALVSAECRVYGGWLPRGTAVSHVFLSLQHNFCYIAGPSAEFRRSGATER
jgi:hypothetical protein